jgi:hypothetical protein
VNPLSLLQYGQDPAYQGLADGRLLLGIPNCVNVVSNLAFVLVAWLGVRATRRAMPIWRDPWERWPYVAFFAGVGLTGVGSIYFHLSPDAWGLLWDRLPMTVAFAGLLNAAVAERVSLSWARRLLVPAVVVGAATVVYWYWSDPGGAGDVRPYAVVQFGSLLGVLLLVLWRHSPYGGGGYLLAGLATYGVAKLGELFDHQIFAMSGIVSGHTLKHLFAAAGTAWVVAMLRRRV